MEIGVEGPARFAPVDHLDTSDFDQPVACPGFGSLRLCIEDYLTHSIRQSGPYRARKQEVMARIWRCVSLFGRPVSITKSARALDLVGHLQRADRLELGMAHAGPAHHPLALDPQRSGDDRDRADPPRAALFKNQRNR